jgi:hypothetical protein
VREQQEQQQRVKREREVIVATVIGDHGDDDEVQWMKSRPAKRGRASPSEDDEVVDLGE